MVSTVRQSTGSIHADARVVASFQEVAAHVADNHPDDVEDTHTTTLRMFIETYVDQYSEAFTENGKDSYVYVNRGDGADGE
jgi:hypothetical protein